MVVLVSNLLQLQASSSINHIRACCRVGAIRSSTTFLPKLCHRLFDGRHRSALKTLGIEPLSEDRADNSELHSAAKGFGKVIGIDAQDILEMFRFAPNMDAYESWKRLLLTWKGVRKGSDIFVKGLGTFDINRAYEQEISRSRCAWSLDILKLLKAPTVKKAYKSVRQQQKSEEKKTTNISFKPNSDDVRLYLAEETDFDLIGLVSSAATEEFKSKGFCATGPPFPPFIEWTQEISWYGEYYRRWVNKEMLMKSLYTGVMVENRPFWLVSVPELQVKAYFATVLSDCGASSLHSVSERKYISAMLCELLAKDEQCPQRRFLIKHHYYWNNPGNIGSIDEIVRAARDDNLFWPVGWEQMSPSSVLSHLETQKRIQERGPDVKYSHLDSLPDSGRLKVLRSKFEIHDAADRLSNCADDYCYDVESMKAVLVMLVDDETRKPVALGMHPLVCEWPHAGWEQILEASNRPPSEEVRCEYYSYSKILRGWHKYTFSPARHKSPSQQFALSMASPPAAAIR